MTHPELVLVLDYGSHYSQMIARRVRELGVYSELHPFNLPIEKIRALNPKGIILSGGPFSTYEEGAPLSSPQIFDLGIPVLGICYGLQLIAPSIGASCMVSVLPDRATVALRPSSSGWFTFLAQAAGRLR